MNDLKISVRKGKITLTTLLCEIVIPAEQWGAIERAVKEMLNHAEAKR